MKNDQGFRAQETYDAAESCQSFSRVERAQLDLMDELKNEFEDSNPLLEQANCYSDLLGAAMSDVNWHEIACSVIEDNVETEDDDEPDQ